MRETLIGIVLGSALCVAQTTKPPQGVPSQVGVHRGKSEMDDKRWTILVVPAKQSYRDFSGKDVWPDLNVECVQRGDKHEFTMVLDARGPLNGVDHGGINSVFIPVKIDNASTERHIWHELADQKSYAYDRAYPYDEEKFNAMKNDELRTQHLVFLEQVLDAKIVFLKFQPLLVNAASEIMFDVRSLKREFAKYPECQGLEAALEE